MRRAQAESVAPHLTCQFIGDTAWNYFHTTQRQGGAFRAAAGVAYPIRMAATSPAPSRDPVLRRLLEDSVAHAPEQPRGRGRLRPGRART